MIKGVNARVEPPALVAGRVFTLATLMIGLILGLRVHSSVAIVLASIGLIGFATTEVLRRLKLGRSTAMKI